MTPTEHTLCLVDRHPTEDHVECLTCGRTFTYGAVADGTFVWHVENIPGHGPLTEIQMHRTEPTPPPQRRATDWANEAHLIRG